MKPILICGDSFAADWTVKYDGAGWPNMLANDYKVTNLAQAGCCEYRIYKQLKSVDLSKFKHIIISHTSPYRIYVEKHPLHYGDVLHGHSDLIYNDLKSHMNDDVRGLVDYFEKHFSIEYADFMHKLICEKIDLLTLGLNVTHIITLGSTHEFMNETLDLTKLFRTNRGSMNHFDDYGNNYVYNKLREMI